MTDATLTAEEEKLLSEGTMTDAGLLAHPHNFYRVMRKGDPIHYDEKLGSWLVSRHEDISVIQKDLISFSVNKGYHKQQARGMVDEFQQILEEKGGGYFPDAIMSDPPYHTRIRRLLENAFTAHRVKELEPRIHEIVSGLLREIGDDSVVDAVKEIAIPLTIRIITEQLGLDAGMEDKISRWSVAVTAQIGRMQTREEMVEHAAQICDLQHYIIGKMKEREAEPREDMISDIMHAKFEGEDGEQTLTFPEAVSLVRALLIAGNDTTATAIGNLFYLLATRPHVSATLEQVVEDDRRLNRFVEELLRVEPPVRALSRMTTREVDVNGSILPEGAHVLLVYGSGNDDETVFPKPREFDIERQNIGRHVAFGGGPHRCVGIALARMEIKVMAREIVRHMKNIKLAIAEDEIRYVPTVATRTIETLPITFDRRG